jgi:hypothetical protein
MAEFRKLWIPEIPCFTVPAQPFDNLTAAAAWSQYYEESGLKNPQSLEYLRGSNCYTGVYEPYTLSNSWIASI